MILDATTKSIQILLGGSVTTNELPFVVSYADVNQSTFAISSISSSDGITTGTTPVTLVAAPGATTTRKISYLSVYNADTVSATVTIRYNNNGTFRQIVVEPLASGSTLVYADTDGWEVTASSAGTPGGSDTQVQFNDSGSLGGDSGLVYNKTTDILTAGSLIVSTEATLPNSGLHVLDTNASHDLIIKPGSDLSADRILTVTTGDAARTVTLSGDTTLSDWFDQSVKSGASPTFTATNFSSIPAANLTGTITSATQDLITRTGTITSGIWNAGAVTSSGAITDSVGSMATIRAGGIGIASQAQYDMLYASSATQLARIANGTTGQVWTATTSGAPSWAAASGGGGLSQSFRGLTLRTHPDADVAAYKVYLDHADEIVLHDGTSVEDWNDLAADITASGANGLDTGSEAASTWYEIHAIRKSSDGTKGLLLHRAKDYTADASYTTARDGGAVLRYDSNAQKVAQGITTVAGGPLQFVDLQIYKAASPTGVVYLTLEADSAGSPSGTPLATSDKLDVTLLTTTNTQWVRFIFRSPTTLAATTVYHVVLNSTVVTSTTNYLAISGTAANGYAGGVLKNYNGSVWAANSNPVDVVFRAYVTQNDTAVTMPTGYDQRALIGWVYNNSGSNFVPFVALDRSVRGYATTVATGFTASILTLTSISAIVPPVPVKTGSWQLVNNTAGALNYIFGDFAMQSSNGNLVFSQIPVANHVNSGENHIVIQNQCVYLYTSGGSAQFYLEGYTW